MIMYLIFMLLLKFVVQLPVFCMVAATKGSKTIWEIHLVSHSECGPNYEPPTAIVDSSGIQPLELFGLYKFQSVYGGIGFVRSVGWDLVSLLVLLLHRETLR